MSWFSKKEKELKKRTKTIQFAYEEEVDIGRTSVHLTMEDGTEFRTLIYGTYTYQWSEGRDEKYLSPEIFYPMQEPEIYGKFIESSLELAKKYIMSGEYPHNYLMGSAQVIIVNDIKDVKRSTNKKPVGFRLGTTGSYMQKIAVPSIVSIDGN
jgi:hypothetical protein